jgi:hypothetical protein
LGKPLLGKLVASSPVLTKYCSWSGQSINALKSSTRFSKNTHHSISISILNILPFNPNTSTFIYLGLPILLGHSKRAAFQSIIDKVQNKVEGWRSKTLSQAGRLVLIKLVAIVIPTMISFLLLTSICFKLDQIFKNFWWGYPSSKTRNLFLKSWDSLCLLKEQGGLGFKKMKDVNLALISKLGWKFHSNSDLMWVAQLRGKYFSSSSFLSPLPILPLLALERYHFLPVCDCFMCLSQNSPSFPFICLEFCLGSHFTKIYPLSCS